MTKKLPGEGYNYGFQDMVVGVKNPELADYKCNSDCSDMLSDAFEKRWIHSIAAGATWSFIKEKINAGYSPFLPKPWVIAEYTATDNVAEELPAMDSDSDSPDDSFQGVIVADFQHDYVAQSSVGIFGLGATEIAESQVCDQDVLTKDETCYKFPVYCLNASDGDNDRANAIATAWKGTSQGHGECREPKEFSSAEEIVF